MDNQETVLQKLRKKSLLWYVSIFLLLCSFIGIGYGIWITYNGIILRNAPSEKIFELLESLQMSIQDGSNALIAFGSIIIIYFFFMTGLAVLGILSSSHYLVKQNIFWFDIGLIGIAIIFGFLGIFSWIQVILISLICILYAYAFIRKYNQDSIKIKRLKKKKKLQSRAR